MKLRGALTGAGALLFLAGILTLLLAPNRFQFDIAVPQDGNRHLALPFGYWIAVAMWAWVVSNILSTDRRKAALRAVVVGLMVEVALGLVPLAAALDARTAVVRVFYAAVLACATAWSLRWMRRRGSTCDTIDLLSFPLVLSMAVVGIAVLRHDPLSAMTSIAVGCVLGVWPKVARAAIAR